MAEYYPLLSRAISSLPNSTPESRKLVYERARKALIGQLRTHQPPVADADIDRESTALDKAIEQLETELKAKAPPLPASGPAAPGPAAPPAAKGPASPPDAPAPAARLSAPPPRIPLPPRPGIQSPGKAPAAPPSAPRPVPAAAAGNVPAPLAPPPPAFRTASNGPAGTAPPPPPPPVMAPQPAPALRGQATPEPEPSIPSPAIPSPAIPSPAIPSPVIPSPVISSPAAPVLEPVAGMAGSTQWQPRAENMTTPAGEVAPPPSLFRDEPQARDAGLDSSSAFKKERLEAQRPVAPLAPQPPGPKRPYWIIFVAIGLVVLLVAIAAYKLKDQPETLIHTKATDQSPDASKIVQRVGGPDKRPADGGEGAPAAGQQSTQNQAPQNQQSNPAVAVAGRAALLVEAPDEPNKVKTYLGTVVWRLDNVNDDQNQTVGLAVRAEITLPDDRLKASVVFQKNTDASLPASHTVKVQFSAESGNVTGNVKTISVPQMRQEDSASGDPLDGVTVPIVENSFLVGLSPGNAESANLQLLNARQWIDIPMTLTNGKLAKLTFEKTEAGQRDLQEAIAAWSK